MRKNLGITPLLLCLGLSLSNSELSAQTNSWTKPSSGNWEERFWSLEMLPGANQYICLTNEGWKAVAIEPSTAQNYPQTLSIGGLTVASPTNSFNELLLNYAGSDHPLVIDGSSPPFLVIASNSAMVLLSSALEVHNYTNIFGEYGDFSVGGTLSSDSSFITAGLLRVGELGPGVCNITNSTLQVSKEIIGSNFPGLFVQQGGSNITAVLQVNLGEYDLYAGQLTGTLYPGRGGTLKIIGGNVTGDAHFTDGSIVQSGGSWDGSLGMEGYGFGHYTLNGGTHSGGMSIPTSDKASGTILQTGGTNTGGLTLGLAGPYGFIGGGTYTLSNGVLATSYVQVRPGGSMIQAGGIHTVTGALNIIGGQVYHTYYVFCEYSLFGGSLFPNSLLIRYGDLAQSGGTNQIAGDLTVSSQGTYNLGAGLLTDANVSLDSDGTFLQTGGTHAVANLLHLEGFNGPNPGGFFLKGGQLTTVNILVNANGAFHHLAGTFTHTGLLTLAQGAWYACTNNQQLGSLQLSTSYSGPNSSLFMPAGASILRFTASTSQVWSNTATLTIENWNGSLSGGGTHRVIFGNSSSALTPQQISQIQFHNPIGASGTYPARILATGEIVPMRLLASQRTAGSLVLSWPAGNVLQSSTNAAGPFTDVPGASSPYPVNFTEPKKFFRLR